MVPIILNQQKINKLDFLDGFRGLACAYVVLYHFWIEINIFYYGVLTDEIRNLCRIFNYGNCSVAVFIAISGYCLMLSPVKSQNSELKGGVAGFLIRRCRRILPGYYVCLFIGVCGFMYLFINL